MDHNILRRCHLPALASIACQNEYGPGLALLKIDDVIEILSGKRDLTLQDKVCVDLSSREYYISIYVLTITVLRRMAAKVGIPVAGSRSELIQRIFFGKWEQIDEMCPLEYFEE